LCETASLSLRGPRMKKTGSEHGTPTEPLARARLQADVAKQRVRIAKDELKRARKRLKEAKREAKRARKLAAAARKAWKRARRAQKSGSEKSVRTKTARSPAGRKTRKPLARAAAPARRAQGRRRALNRRRAAQHVRRLTRRRAVAKRVLAKPVVAKRVLAKRVPAKPVVAKHVPSKPVVGRPLRRRSGPTRRSRPVRPAPTTGARGARTAAPAQRVLRRRSRASVTGRAAGIAAEPTATRETTPPVPVPETAPGLDNATVAATPDQAS